MSLKYYDSVDFLLIGSFSVIEFIDRGPEILPSIGNFIFVLGVDNEGEIFLQRVLGICKA